MAKGMLAYSIIWPLSSLAQQKINAEPLDLKRAFR